MSRSGVASDRMLFHHGIKPAVLVIEDGIIVDVLDRGRSIGAPIEDVGELLVMPALIDTNVHVSDPGRPEWEGYATATAAAAAGGVAAIADMPLEAVPPTISVAGLNRKRAVTRGVIKVDVGFWGGVVGGGLLDMPLLADAGVLGFFAALIDSGLGPGDRVSVAELEGALQTAARLGLPVLVDAEAPEQLSVAPAPGADHGSYLESRPAAAEVAGIAAAIGAAGRSGGWVHLVHVSSGEGIGLIAEARRMGIQITAETCPHYLTMHAEEIPATDPTFKASPPIRSALDRERLWDGLLSGAIDMIVSDHSPCPPEYRRGEYADAWSGIASLELRLPVVWTEAQRRGVGLAHVVRWLSEAPGALMGMKTGSIEPGRRADLVAWDPDAEFVVDPSRLHQRHPETPYAGVPLRGVVHNTWVAGELVFADRKPIRAAKGSLLELV
jgi:allantoinase